MAQIRPRAAVCRRSWAASTAVPGAACAVRARNRIVA